MVDSVWNPNRQNMVPNEWPSGPDCENWNECGYPQRLAPEDLFKRACTAPGTGKGPQTARPAA